MDFLGDLKIPTVTSLPSVAQSSGEVVQYNGQLYYCDGSQWHQITPPSGSSGWSLTGNSGTNPSTNFIGTTDNQALAIRVNNQETFRFNVPGTSAPAWSIQRGGGNQRGLYAVDLQSDRSLNTQVASGSYSVISGGTGNTASSSYAVVSGGRNNTASGSGSTVGGGNTNTASTSGATVGGGETNTASGVYGTVSGGVSNTASGNYSVVSGGVSNTASLNYSVVSGGYNNVASGDYSAIAGGYNLRVGNRSFGFSGQSSTTQTNLSANNNIAAFVDVDLWLYNVRNQASKIKLFEPSGSGTNYTSFEAQPQSTNIEYKLPASASPTDTPANKILQADTLNNLSWLNAQHLQPECEQWEQPKFWDPLTASRVDTIEIAPRILYPILWDARTIKPVFPNDINVTSNADQWHFDYSGTQNNHVFEVKIFLYIKLRGHPINDMLSTIPRLLQLRWYYSNDPNNWATPNFHSILDIARDTVNMTLLTTGSYNNNNLPAKCIVLEGSVRFVANNSRISWKPMLTYDDAWANGNPPSVIFCNLVYGYIEIIEIGHMFNEHIADTSNPFDW